MPETKAQRSAAARKGAATRKRHPAESKEREQASAVDRTAELSDEVLKSLESGQRAAIEAVTQVRRHRRPDAAGTRRASVQAPGSRRRRHGDGRPARPHAVRLPSQGRAERRNDAEQAGRREVGPLRPRPVPVPAAAGSAVRSRVPRADHLAIEFVLTACSASRPGCEARPLSRSAAARAPRRARAARPASAP